MTYKDEPWITQKGVQWLWDDFLPDKAKGAEPAASLLQAFIDQPRGLLPAFIIVDENDVLRDEGEA